MSDFYYTIFLILSIIALNKCTNKLLVHVVLKRGIKALFPVFLALVVLSPFTTEASHIAGSEITYRWISGNSFELKLKLYRDCSGIAAPPTVSVNYRSVSCGYNRNVTLTPIPGTGQEITRACSTAATTCSGGSNPGIQEYIYKGIVTLPAQCTDWVFSYGLCCRNCAITTLTYSPPNCNGIPSMYVDARLNNLVAPTNSSPEFTNIPITFVCIGQTFNYNHGAIDADGDSLVYSFINPRDNALTNVVYSAGYSATQPISSSPPVTIDPALGDITMSPTNIEVSVMAVLIREYRNGVLIGSIVRDMQIWTQPCSNLLPTATGINGTANFDLVVCAGTPINFNIHSFDPNSGQLVTMSWNFGIPGATFTSSGSPFPTATFSWTPTLADVRLQPYTFTVIVRDNNCPNNGFQIYSYSILVRNVMASVSSTNVLCNGTATGTATVVPSGGSPAYSYVWSPGGFTTQSISALASGSYTVTVTDSYGCSTISTVGISSPPPLLANVPAFSNVSCYGGNNGSASVTVSGGTAPYTYAWSPSGGTSAVATGLGAGTYNLTVTDANNCIQSSTVSITQPLVLASSIISSAVSCFGGSNATAAVSVLGGTSPYTYTWSPSGATTASATGLSAGTNAVLITDAHGCSALNNVTIGQSPALNLSTTANPATCGSANGNATALISGGIPPYNFLWTPNGATTASVSGLVAGAYSVRVTDAFGCVVNASSAISNIGGPTAVIASMSPVSCFGGSNGSTAVSVAGGTAPFTYTWFPGGGNSPSITGLSAGNYTVTIRDGNNCSTSISANIIQPPQLQLNPSFTNLSCSGSHNGSASVAVSGGMGSYSYHWTPGGGTTSSITNINAGSYSVVVTDVNNCSSSTSIVVAQPPALAAVIPSLSHVSCAGSNNGSAMVSVSGGTSPYSFSWSPTGGAAAAASGLASGTYTVTVTDAHNCVQTATAIILQPPALTTAPVVSNVMCYGGNNGSASVIASGGTSPYTYLWSPTGGTNAIASGLSSGNYAVTVTDAHNCIQSSNVSIAQPSSLNSQIPVSNNVSCYGGSNGSATVYATGGTSPYTYLWSPSGGSMAAATGLVAGHYSVTVTDANNCTDISTVIIIQPAQLTSSIPVFSDVSCFGGNNGAATVTVSGGTAPYLFAWSPSSATTDTATGLAQGNYSVNVTDAVGCVTSAAVLISQPPPLILSASSTPATCGNANGAASSAVSGGTSPYIFLWMPGGVITSSVSGLAAGPYSVRVTDAKGCIISASAAVSNFGGPTAAISALNPVSCFGGSNGSASVAVSGGTAPFSYSWSPSGGTSAAASGLAAGNYTVSIRDGNNCSSSVTAAIPQPPPLLINTTSSDLSCFGSRNGSVSAGASGGAGVYSYLWTPGGGTTQSMNGLPAGTYHVTVSDINNCTLSSAVSVAEPLALVAVANASPVNCFGGNNGSVSTFVSGGTGPFSYAWLPSGGSSPDATGLAAGTYVVVVTDAHNCTRSVSSTVVQPDALFAHTFSSDVSCYGGSNGMASVTMSGGTPPFVFSWSPSGGNSTIANGLSSGTYTVNITDANNCMQSSVLSITQPPDLSASIPASTNVLCFGGNNGSATVAASGGTGPYTYLWSPSGGTAAMAAGLAAGNYSVTVRDINNCIESSNVSILQPAALNVSAPLVTNVTCHGGSNGNASVAVSGGTSPYSYSWSPVGGSAASASGLTAGTYSVLITDANGCQLSAVSSIVEPQPLALSASTSPATCSAANGSAAASIAGGVAPYAFLWSPSGATSSSLPGIAAGAYSVTVTDSHGCTAAVSAAVSNIGGPTASVSALSPVSCFGGSNGSATVSVTGGTSPFSYAWFPNGGTTANVSGIAAGNYTVTVTDGNYCLTSLPVSISQPPVLNATASSLPALCSGDANGAVSATASGGTSPYTFVWSFGNTSPSVTNMAAGNYQVAITDFNGCSQSASVEVRQPPSLSAFISNVTNVLCAGGTNGAASVAVSGGTFPYTYLWTPTGSPAPTVTGLAAGNYSVTIQDAHNCMQTTSTDIIQPAALLLAPSVSNVSCFGGSNGSASVYVTGGTLPYSYSWFPSGGHGAEASGLTSGNYTIQVTDDHGCLLSSAIAVDQPDVLNASIPGSFNVSCFGGNDGSAAAAVSGGVSPYSYSWLPSGGTDSIASGLSSGNYTVTVTDANNCSQTSVVSIFQPLLLTAAIPSSTNVSCYHGNDGSASAIVNGGTSPYLFSWTPSGGTAPVAIGLSAGHYSVNVTDAHGCIAVNNVTVNEPDSIIVNTNSFPATCYGYSNGSAYAAVASGGTSPFLYNWSPLGGNNSTATNLFSGTYTVTINDHNGCIVSTTVSVNQPTEVILNTTTTDVSCFGGNNGTTGVNAAGGTQPYSYVWSPVGGTNVTASNLHAGIYHVDVTDSHGCLSSISATVNQPPVLNVNVQGTSTICIGQNASVSASASGGVGNYLYQWSNGVNSSSQVLSPVTSSSYSVLVTDGNGCTVASPPLLINVNPPLLAAANGSNPICIGETTIVSASGSGGNGGPFNYVWNNGMSGQSIHVSPAVTTTYVVSVSDGCTTPNVLDSTTVVVNPLPAVNFVPHPLTGCEPLLAHFLDGTTTSPGSIYIWNFGDGSHSTQQSPVHLYHHSGSYSVSLTVMSHEGCVNDLTVQNAVIVYPLPTALFVTDPERTTILNPTISFVDQSIEAARWDWDFGDGLGRSVAQNTSYTYQDTGAFVIRLITTSDKGCIDTTYGRVIIEGDFVLYIPNAFTPNEDGVNDGFVSNGIGVKDFDMYIFDRWGLQIFHTTSMNQPWDGKVQGSEKMCQIDVYIYKIIARDVRERVHEYIGHLSLVR